MRSVSPAHEAAMAARVREIDARVHLVLGGLFPLAELPSVSVSWAPARISHPEHLVDGELSVRRRYAVLGQWVVGSDEWGLAPSDGAQQMGVWGSASYVGGSRDALSPPAVITVTYPEPREVVAVTLAADPRWPGIPTAWSAELRLGGTTIATVTGPGTGHRQTVAVPGAPVLIDELVITITGWTQGERVRVVEASIADTVSWDAGQLVRVRWLSELVSDAGELSADEASVTVTGVDDLPALEERLVSRPGRLSAEIGPRGLDPVRVPPMWTRQVRTSGQRVELVAQDAVALLTNRRYPGFAPAAGVTAQALVEDILMASGLPSSQWVVDAALGSITLPWAALPAQNVRPALAELAPVIGAAVFTDSSGRLVVRQLSEPDGFVVIDESDVYAAEQPVDDVRLATRVEVTWGQLALAAPAVLGEWRGTLSGTQVVSVEWDEPAANRTPTLTGCTLVSVIADEPCRWVASVSGTGDATVSISGRVLRRVTSSVAVAEDPIATLRYGLRVHRIDHPLIQAPDQAQAIADRLLAERGTLRSRLRLIWRGDLRLEPGDGITWRGQQWVIERVETELGRSLRQILICRRATV